MQEELRRKTEARAKRVAAKAAAEAETAAAPIAAAFTVGNTTDNYSNSTTDDSSPALTHLTVHRPSLPKLTRSSGSDKRLRISPSSRKQERKGTVLEVVPATAVEKKA